MVEKRSVRALELTIAAVDHVCHPAAADAERGGLSLLQPRAPEKKTRSTVTSLPLSHVSVSIHPLNPLSCGRCEHPYDVPVPPTTRDCLPYVPVRCFAVPTRRWSSPQVRIITSNNCLSAGDALRDIDQRGVVRSDPFILVSGDVVSNVDLKAVIKQAGGLFFFLSAAGIMILILS